MAWGSKSQKAVTHPCTAPCPVLDCCCAAVHCYAQLSWFCSGLCSDVLKSCCTLLGRRHLSCYFKILATKLEPFKAALITLPQTSAILTRVGANSPKFECCFDSREELLEQAYVGVFSGDFRLA